MENFYKFGSGFDLSSTKSRHKKLSFLFFNFSWQPRDGGRENWQKKNLTDWEAMLSESKSTLLEYHQVLNFFGNTSKKLFVGESTRE